MARLAMLIIDVALVLAAAIAAILLRDNLEFVLHRFDEAAFYLSATAMISVAAICGIGLNRSIWRFSALPDYVRIVCAVLIIVAATSAATFAYNRLDGVSRSLPILHALIAIAMLVGARILARLNHSREIAARGARSMMQ
jgi:FlaA1/EpsC-like NDP-sugar epimerase